jgi:hypothetical protein
MLPFHVPKWLRPDAIPENYLWHKVKWTHPAPKDHPFKIQFKLVGIKSVFGGRFVARPMLMR